MLITLNRKRFVNPLINMPAPCTVPMLMPAPHVPHRQPLHESPQLAVLPRPEHQMPMIRHQTIPQQPHRNDLQCLLQGLLKRQIIPLLQKDSHPAIPPVEHMKHHPTRRNSIVSWHPSKDANFKQIVNKCTYPLLRHVGRKSPNPSADANAEKTQFIFLASE